MHNKKIVSVIAILMAVLMLLSLLSAALPVIAHADTVTQTQVDEIQEKKDALAAQTQKSEDKLTLLQQQHASVLEQKEALDEKNRIATEQITLTQQQIELYGKMIAEKSKEVDAARKTADKQLEKYRGRVRAMEENGGYSANIVALICNVRSLSELLTMIDDISEIMNSDRRLEEQYVEAREAHEEVKAEYEEIRSSLEKKQDELEKEKADLEQKIVEAYTLIAQLEEDIEKAKQEYAINEAKEAAMSSYLSELSRKLWEEQEAKRLAEEERRRQEEEERQKQETEPVDTTTGGESGGSETGGETTGGETTGGETTGGETTGSETTGGETTGSETTGGETTGGETTGGETTGSETTGGETGGSETEPVTDSFDPKWPCPSCKLITSRYGWRVHPIYGDERFHSGVDIGAADGAAIVAADDGTVVISTYSDSYGNYIMIDHGNGYSTVYAHIQNGGLLVSAGQTVAKGDTIGLVGSTGWATGPHCHFEIRYKGDTADPTGYFSGLSYWNC